MSLAGSLGKQGVGRIVFSDDMRVISAEKLGPRVHAQSSTLVLSVMASHPSHPHGIALTSSTEVLREGICQRVAQASGQLVLVRAPAGFGKTTAMLQARTHLQRLGVDTAWLTLEHSDNDLSRCVGRLLTALRPLGLQGDLVRDLMRREQPFALFLDEFELVHEESVMGVVRELVHQLPVHGQVVIGTRTLPALGLARLRVRRRLTEIDTELLRFDLGSSNEFLRRQNVSSLPPAQLQALHRKTEGWIAALWLAALALQRSLDPADFVDRFSGSDRAVADYLAEEVLARQPEAVRRFLLRTSVLRQLEAPACAALCPETDALAMLEHLAGAHLFVTPVTGAVHTWRYHSLMADYLRSQLVRQDSGSALELHACASQWYADQGRAVPAIDHAFEAGEVQRALLLLLQHAEEFLQQGRMRMLSRWFAQCPLLQLAEHPALVMVALWASCFTRGPWASKKLWQQCRQAGVEPKALSDGLGFIEPLWLAMQDRLEDALHKGQPLLELQEKSETQSLHFGRATMLNAMAYLSTVSGQPSQARRWLDAARAQQPNSAFQRMYAESTEAVLDLQQGQLRQASARLRLAVQATRTDQIEHTQGNAWAGVLYAAVVYDGGQIDDAEHLLAVYTPLAVDVGLPDHMILSHAMRSRIAWLHGDVDGAWLVLTELEQLGHQRHLPRVVAAARLERARLELLQGHSDAALEELARADHALWTREPHLRWLAHDIEYPALAHWRWQVHAGDPCVAAAQLRSAIAQAIGERRVRRGHSLQLLRALALHRMGESSAALEALLPVVQHAAAQGMVRQLLDEGPILTPLLQRLQQQIDLRQLEARSSDPQLTEHLQQLLLRAPKPAGATAIWASAVNPIEPLTAKEQQVLQLLEDGLSNSGMATQLKVSDSTVRTHLRNINSKLGASNRTQAVAIARRLGWL